MGSVRERIERELREAPEVVVPTSNRRVALAAGGSVSTRQTQERRDDAATPEGTVHRDVTSSASVGLEQPAVRRLRDRQSVAEAMKPEVARPRTETEQAADYYYALHKQREAEAKAAEQAKVAAQQKRIADERAAAEARRQVEAARSRKAQHDFLEAAVMREASDLTSEETQVFWERLVAMNACLDAGAASVVAESIRSSRKVQEDSNE